MRIKAAYQKFKSSFADPVFRTRALALVGGKVIGLTLVLSAMYVWLAPSLHAQAAAPAGPTPRDERVEYRVGAAGRVPGVLHAGGFRDAGGRFRAIA